MLFAGSRGHVGRRDRHLRAARPRWSCSPGALRRLAAAATRRDRGRRRLPRRRAAPAADRRRLGGLRDLPPPAATPTLTVARGRRARSPRSARVTGAGFAGPAARAGAASCSARRPPTSSGCCAGCLGGELRQGAQAGLLADAIAGPPGCGRGGPAGAAARRRPEDGRGRGADRRRSRRWPGSA